MKRLLSGILLAASIATTAASPSASQTRTYGSFVVGADGASAVLSGEIGMRTATEFRRVVREHPDLRTLFLDSPGGNVDIGLALAGQVHDAGIETRVDAGDTCASACSFVFLAGRRRHLEGRLGVHQFSGRDGGQSDTQTVVADISSSLADFGVSAHVIAAMFAAKPDDMRFFTPEEVRRFGLTTDGSVPAEAEDAGPPPAAVSTSVYDASLPPEPEPSKPVAAGGPSVVFYAGLDLYGGDVGMRETATVAECALACMRGDACVAFTYNTRTSPGNGANCFMKGSFDFVDRNAVAISGMFLASGEAAPDLRTVRGIDPLEDVAEDVAFAGGRLVRPKSSATGEECRAACMRDDACEGFTHVRETERCTLFGSISNVLVSDGARSGRKTRLELPEPKVVSLDR